MFHPFSDEYFDDPSEVYRRLREELGYTYGARCSFDPRRAELSREAGRLAVRLGLPFVDADQEIEQAAGCTIEVVGGELVDHNRSHIVVANHQSMFDPVLVGYSSRRYLSFLARAR